MTLDKPLPTQVRQSPEGLCQAPGVASTRGGKLGPHFVCRRAVFVSLFSQRCSFCPYRRNIRGFCLNSRSVRRSVRGFPCLSLRESASQVVRPLP